MYYTNEAVDSLISQVHNLERGLKVRHVNGVSPTRLHGQVTSESADLPPPHSETVDNIRLKCPTPSKVYSLAPTGALSKVMGKR